jgi:hypothetical protein
MVKLKKNKNLTKRPRAKIRNQKNNIKVEISITKRMTLKF